MDTPWGLNVELRVLNMVVYIITGVLYTAEFSKERDARHQAANRHSFMDRQFL
jgi:hypothetical protein